MKEQKLANAQIEQVKKIHGANTDSRVLAHQGASLFYNSPSMEFPAGNPITSSGTKVLKSMQKNYGAKKGKSVFYASMNKGVSGSRKWHK